MAVRINRFAVAVCLTVVAGASFADSPDASGAVMAGLEAAMPAKLAVSEKYIKTGAWPGSNSAAGFEAAEGAASVNVGTGGMITITFNASAGLAGKSITLTPSSSGKDRVNWSCKGEDFPAGALPEACR